MSDNPLEILLAAFSQEIEERIYSKLIKRLDQIDRKKEELEKNEYEYLTIGELCDLTGLKKATIYAKRSRRELPAYKFGRELRFRRSEIENWIKTKRQTCLTSDGGSV